jgi:hypothetical protein
MKSLCDEICLRQMKSPHGGDEIVGDALAPPFIFDETPRRC